MQLGKRREEKEGFKTHKPLQAVFMRLTEQKCPAGRIGAGCGFFERKGSDAVLCCGALLLRFVAGLTRSTK